MSFLKKTIMLAAVTIFIVGAYGCEKEGTGERAGKKIDKMVEDVKDTVKDATE